MPTQYSHSPDILCLSIRALRLSGEEAPANSGSFLSPGAARWNHVGWSCVREKTGPREQWRLTSFQRLSSVFRNTWKNSNFYLHCGSGSSVAPTQKGWNPSVWLTHSSNFSQVSFAVRRRGEERRERDLSGCQCCITASSKTPVEVNWLSAPTRTASLSWFFQTTVTHFTAFKALAHTSASQLCETG